VLDIEVEGVKQIQASGFPARYVFIAPPSEEELERRLRGRGTEKEDSIQKRLKQAKVELEYSRVPGVHDRVIVNQVCLYRSLLGGGYADASWGIGLGGGVQGARGVGLC
jgi:guanylate kinase